MYLHVTENRKDIIIFPPNLALKLTLISSNYPCLEHIFMVPKVFEPMRFYCNILSAAKRTRTKEYLDVLKKKMYWKQKKENQPVLFSYRNNLSTYAYWLMPCMTQKCAIWSRNEILASKFVSESDADVKKKRLLHVNNSNMQILFRLSYI